MKKSISHRQLKKDIAVHLLHADTDAAFQPIMDLPERASVNALLSFFYHSDPLVKWRAVSAVGMVTDQLARKEIESARVIMRRLMWTLNDESGGIGWGAPEAMGDAMARNGKIAGEYHRILLSYIVEDQNYLEHEILQRGVLWGIGRLAHQYPDLCLSVAPYLNPFMDSPDPLHRGHAAWAALPLKQETNVPYLTKLIDDPATFDFYDEDYKIKEISISRLAQQAVKR